MMSHGVLSAIVEVEEWGSVLRGVVVGAIGSYPPRIRIDAQLSAHDRDRVLSWARREIAQGKRVSWLLADELDDLA